MKIYKILIHCFIGALVTRATLCPPFLNYKYGKYAGISLSGLVWSMLFYSETFVSTTLYDYLDVTPNASKRDIEFNYNKIISSAESNSIKYQRVTKAYKVLSSKELRENYDKFGDLSNEDSTDSIVLNAVILAVSFQIILFATGYVLTYSKYLKFSRQLFFIYNLIALALILELRLVSGEGSLDKLYIFQDLLKFQIVEVIQALFPSAFTLCCIVSCLLFVDDENDVINMMRGSLMAERVLVNKISQLQSIGNSKREESTGQSDQIIEDFKNLVETLNNSQKESLERILKYISGSSHPILPDTPSWKKNNTLYLVIFLGIYYLLRYIF